MNQELERLLVPGTPNVEIVLLPSLGRYMGSCLVCWAIKGKYGQGFTGEYSSSGRALAALRRHFAAAHGMEVITGRSP